MGKLSKKQIGFLKDTFGDKVSFNPVELKLYGHDIAAMPSLFKPLIGNTTPWAVVKPGNEEQLVQLVKWANANRIPLTPRGKGSSGYGGVIPVKNGIVVDFYDMKNIAEIDKKDNTVTVDAGIVWEGLDRELKKEGMTLCLYPTSYPSSTAAGWLAQGGAGIGSYEYGWYRDNVISARVVTPDGEVAEYTGEELDVIADAEGITGIISQVKLKIQPLEELDIVSIGCPDAYGAQQLLETINDSDLPIWSLMFINPRMAELKNRAPLRTHNGHPVEERVLLPASYIITLAFRKKDSEVVQGALEGTIKKCEAEILSDRIAHHEWENRFNLMVVKRLGPSLVPAEVVVPLKNLGKVMTEIEDEIDQPIVKEGVVIRNGVNGEPEVVILGFIPSDQRTFGYNLVFGLVITLMKIAEKYGGRPYSTGLYFGKRVNEVIGVDRAKKIRQMKRKVDPRGILNPGKVTESGVAGTALGLANIFEPLIRPFGNYVIAEIGELPEKDVKGIPADIAWYAYSCSQCGYCVDTCDQFYGRGWESQSPRGKWYWMREYMEGREEWNQFMVDTIMVCTTCEMCDHRCSAALPIEPSWMKLRGQLIEDEGRLTIPPFEMMAAALSAEGNIWAGYRKDRTDWFPEDLKDKYSPDKKAKNVYFAGCTVSYVENDMGQAAVRLLDETGVDFAYVGKKENCCGTPMLVAGKWELFAETMKKNIEAVKSAGADTVISSCPACDMMWRTVYPEWAEKLGVEYGITAKHYSELIAEKLESGEFEFPDNGGEKETVTWHDSCHIGRASGVYEPPRDMIKALPNADFVEMEFNREEAHCCGSVLTLIKEPDVAKDIGKVKLDEAEAAGASKILALCPCCEFQLRVTQQKLESPIEIVDLARYAASTLGYEFPDPNPEVREQWVVFEAMIALMTPQGFAKLMGTMWPELINAMPFGMGPMMKVMGKIPGALQLMKPMFPILFPRLLPMMMPKVMPTMLSRVADMVPMPDYMAEQMPELMPKVMDNLMPHMIDDVVPLVTDPMIAHLRGKNGGKKLDEKPRTGGKVNGKAEKREETTVK